MASAENKQNGTAFYEGAGATLLAQQSDDVGTFETIARGDKWERLKAHLEARLVALRMWRQSWWTQSYSDLAEYLLPKRSIWLTQSAGGVGTPNSMTRGRQVNNSIVDPTGTFAARICSGGLMSGLASPSRPWFKIIPAIRNVDLDSDARDWIDETEDRMYTILAGSNFYNSFAQEIEDLVIYGTAPSVIYEDESDVLRLYNPAVGEYYLSTGATMRIDGLYRQFVMTVAQVVDFFGIDACPPTIAKLWAEKGGQLETEVIVAHSIEPNFGIGGTDTGKVPGDFTWREIYWLWGTPGDHPLSMRGFKDQPFTAARWSTQSNDAYGRSPGMDVLPDVVQLQFMTRRQAEAIEKQVRPPLIADMSLKHQPSSSLPGHVTYVDSLDASKGMRPIYQVAPDINAMSLNIQQIQKRIQVGLFNDLFLMLEQQQPQRTAYEVAQKVQEKLQVLGPVIEGLLSESLKPKLKRIYAIIERRGMLPPKPDSLKDTPLDVEFVSTLAIAQRAASTSGIERLLALVGNMAGIKPEALDNIDFDAAVREMSYLLGNPEKILTSNAIRDQLRAARAQQQQAAQQMQGVGTMAGAANQGAQAAQVLSQTEVGGGQNALAALLGQGR